MLNHLSNVLTVEEWQLFKATDDYLWMAARAQGYSGKEMDELVKRGAVRRDEAWKIALEIAESVIAQDMAEVAANVTEEQKRQVVVSMAEKLLMEQNITPPTFTAWADCDSCGRVLVHEGTPESTPNCPWCML